MMQGYLRKDVDPSQQRQWLYSTPSGGQVWVDAVGDDRDDELYYPEVRWQCIGPVVMYLGRHLSTGDDTQPPPGVLIRKRWWA